MHQMIGHSRSVDHANDAMLGRVSEPPRHVLGGGALLHRMPRQHGTRYGKRTTPYADFAVRHYDLATTVIFDGYEEGSFREHNIHTVLFSLLRHTSQTRRKSSCQEAETNRDG